MVSVLNSESLQTKDLNNLLTSVIATAEGFALCRPGGTESVGLKHFLTSRLAPGKSKRKYPKGFVRTAAAYSGITVLDQDEYDFVFHTYLKGIMDADVLGYGMFARDALSLALLSHRMGQPVTHFQHLDPAKSLEKDLRPWSLELEGKRVLVVHPFEKSIYHQFERRHNVRGVAEWLPNLELEVLKPPTELGAGNSRTRWLENYQKVSSELRSRTFDVAIIGAGAYGLPLAAEVKKLGKVGIHLGGTTQLLFGVSGSRWDGKAPFSLYQDASWIRPLESDLFAGVGGIEGGSYT